MNDKQTSQDKTQTSSSDNNHPGLFPDQIIKMVSGPIDPTDQQEEETMLTNETIARIGVQGEKRKE